PGAPTASSEPDAVALTGAFPPCQLEGPAVATRDVRDREAGTKVSVHGMLVHHPKWDCPTRTCAGKRAASGGGVGGGVGTCCGTCTTPWFVVDEAEVARPYMSRARLYLRARGQTEPFELTAQDCEVRAANAAALPRKVVVSGVFQGPAGRGGGSYLIEDPRLCTP
ncbi:MAG: hypothetical protein ABUL67_01055, partial [Haliangium ochraceum]